MTYAIIHIYGTTNNTMCIVTDATMQFTLFRISGGLTTKAGRDKNSLKTAAKLFIELNNFLIEAKVKHIELRIRNKGSSYNKYITSAVKLLQKSLRTHYNVVRVLDVTPITHGYIKRQKIKTR